MGDQNLDRLPAPQPFAPQNSLLASTGNPSSFHLRSANSALMTGSSDMSPTRGYSGYSEENIQGQSLHQKRSYPHLLGSNNVESESSKRNRISMPPELYSTALQTPTSDFDSSNDVNGQRIVPQENVGFSNWDGSQSQNLPFPKESDPPMTAKTDILTPAARPEVKILVVESSGPQITIKKWPGGNLRGRTLKSIFDEVSATFSAQTLQRIKFQLQALKKENGLECLIERDDDEAFDLMMQKFNERIKECMRAGETRFKLILEIDRGVQEATEIAVSEASGSEEDYL